MSRAPFAQPLLAPLTAGRGVTWDQMFPTLALWPFPRVSLLWELTHFLIFSVNKGQKLKGQAAMALSCKCVFCQLHVDVILDNFSLSVRFWIKHTWISSYSRSWLSKNDLGNPRYKIRKELNFGWKTGHKKKRLSAKEQNHLINVSLKWGNSFKKFLADQFDKSNLLCSAHND